MNSKQAFSILTEIKSFLEAFYFKLTLIELEDNDYTKNYSDKILPEFTIYKHLPSNIKIDSGSCFLLPKEYKKLICGTSTADGNCLFHSASIILYGNECQFMQLRLAVIIELMKNARRYLEIETFETDITYTNDALDSAVKQKSNNSIISEYNAN